MSNLYNQNDTMKLLGKQSVIMAHDEEWQAIESVISAYIDAEEDSLTQLVMMIFKKGILSNFLGDIYNLGVINGKRKERTRKKAFE